MAKSVEQLEQVTIRFAGDSGDGMQLTGGRFTSETALFGNDLSTLPDFPAEIRAPAGSLPGVSGFQIHYADHDILTPGDAPQVLVAMNPAALRTNLKDLPAGRDADRQQRRVQRPQPPEGRLHREPAGGRLARRVPRPRGAADVAHARGGQGHGPLEPRGGALEEHVRARAHVVALHAPYPGHDRLPREEVREAAGDRRREYPRVQGRLRVRRDGRGLRDPIRGGAREAAARDVPEHHGQPGARARAGGGRACSRSCRSSSARTRSRRLPTSSTTSRATRTSASAPSRPRTRSPPWEPHSARASAARSVSAPRAARA